MSPFWGEFAPAERWRTAWAIVRKDLRRVWILWLVVLAIASVFAVLMSSDAARQALWKQQACNGQYGYIPPECERYMWHEYSLTPLYAYAAGVLALSLPLALLVLYGEEIRRGTIRSVVLYGLDLNDVTTGKILSASIGGGVTGALAFLVPMSPYFILGLFPLGDYLLILVVAFFAILTTVLFGAFLAHLLMRAFRSYASPAGFAGLMALLAVVTTRSISYGLLWTVASAVYRPTSSAEWAVLQEGVGGLADAFAYLSPIHIGGRLLGTVFGLNPPGLDLWVVLPAAVLVVLFGFLEGRKVYLDVFFR